VHSDAHAIAFLPNNANTVFVASDGGLAKTTKATTARDISADPITPFPRHAKTRKRLGCKR